MSTTIPVSFYQTEDCRLCNIWHKAGIECELEPSCVTLQDASQFQQTTTSLRDYCCACPPEDSSHPDTALLHGILAASRWSCWGSWLEAQAWTVHKYILFRM